MTNNIPYIHVEKVEDKVYRASSALKLVSIYRGEWLKKHNDRIKYVEDTILKNQLRLIQSLSKFDENNTFGIRFTSKPDQNYYKGRVDFSFIVSSCASTPKKSRSKNEGLFGDIRSLFSVLSDVYEFDVVTSEDDFTSIYSPFELTNNVEITRRRDKLSLDSNKHRGNYTGLVKAEANDNNPDSIDFIYSFHENNDSFSNLCHILLQHKHRVMVSITLTPTILSSDCEKYLKDTIERCERYLQLNSNSELLELIEPVHRLQADILRRVYLERFIRLKEGAFRMKIKVFSPHPVPDGIIYTLGGSISSSPNKNEDLQNHFSGGFSTSGQDERENSIVNLIDPMEARACFRFPYPEDGYFPGVDVRLSKTTQPPKSLPDEGLDIGKSLHNGIIREVKINNDDRRRHLYALGQTGTGKSTLFRRMVLEDIYSDRGVCVIDPHKDLIQDIIDRLPKERSDDVIIFDPTDVERPIPINLLDFESEQQRYFIVQEMVSYCKKLWNIDYMGPMFFRYVRNGLLTLMADKKNVGTLVEFPRLFTEDDYHKKYLDKITDPLVLNFWKNEWEKTSTTTRGEMMTYVISKFDNFVCDPVMRNIIGWQRCVLDFRKIIDGRNILLCNLARGKLGEINSGMLGMIFMTKLQAAALSRVDIPEDEREDFYLYVDEFQHLASDTFNSILSEARKYHLNLSVTNQYINQLDDNIKAAITGNIGTQICFRVGIRDAEYLANIFKPVFDVDDLLHLPNYNVIVNSLINGNTVRPFSMRTILDNYPENKELGNCIKELSRLKYGIDRKIVEADIHSRYE